MNFKRFWIAAALAIASTSALASPIGTLKSEGRFQVISAGSDQPVTINQPEYTFYSGDTVIARKGASVLNLNNGGGLGFTAGSKVTVAERDDGRVETEVQSGSLLYAFPDGRSDFAFRVGNFTVQGRPREAQAIQVASEGESVGTIEHLDGGNMRATVRSGSLHISNGEAVRYQVAAGESVGLLDLPEGEIRTQGAAPASGSAGRQPPILIQSPERVGTNEDFLIRWEALEPVDGDYIVIARSGAEPDEFETLVNSDEGKELELNAPGSPGDYEIRFIDGQTGEVKRFVYLDVRPNLVGGFWAGNAVGGAIAVAGAGVAVYIGTQIADDDDPDPVSP